MFRALFKRPLILVGSCVLFLFLLLPLRTFAQTTKQTFILNNGQISIVEKQISSLEKERMDIQTQGEEACPYGLVVPASPEVAQTPPPGVCTTFSRLLEQHWDEEVGLSNVLRLQTKLKPKPPTIEQQSESANLLVQVVKELKHSSEEEEASGVKDSPLTRACQRIEAAASKGAFARSTAIADVLKTWGALFEGFTGLTELVCKAQLEKLFLGNQAERDYEHVVSLSALINGTIWDEHQEENQESIPIDKPDWPFELQHIIL